MNKTLLTGLLSLLLAFTAQTLSAQSYNADKGWEAYEKEDYKTALEYFSRHLKDSPNDAVILHTRSLIYGEVIWMQFKLSQKIFTIAITPTIESYDKRRVSLHSGKSL